VGVRQSSRVSNKKGGGGVAWGGEGGKGLGHIVLTQSPLHPIRNCRGGGSAGEKEGGKGPHEKMSYFSILSKTLSKSFKEERKR